MQLFVSFSRTRDGINRSTMGYRADELALGDDVDLASTKLTNAEGALSGSQSLQGVRMVKLIWWEATASKPYAGV